MRLFKIIALLCGLAVLGLAFGGCAGSSRRAPTPSEVRHQDAMKLQICERAAFRSLPEPPDSDDAGLVERDEKRRENVRECLRYGDMSEHGYVTNGREKK